MSAARPVTPPALVRLDTVASTNDEALARARDGAPDGTAVFARAQTRGRGRVGRSWHSPDGDGCYLSLIHRPRLPPAELAGLTLELAVAVARVLEAEGAAPRLKWPNDVLLPTADDPTDLRKVAGILTELHLDAPPGPVLIIGLGVNVNADPAAFPDDLALTATSLRAALGRQLDLDALVAHLSDALRAACDAFDARGRPDLEGYLARSASIGRRVRVDPAGAEGVVCGVDDDGALLVHFTGRDRPEPVRAGVVTHLRDDRARSPQPLSPPDRT